VNITLEDVSYGAGNRLLLEGVSFEVPSGKVLGLIGPNGSGKSSLLRLICRLRNVRSGVIRMGADDVLRMPRQMLARRMSLVEQHSATDTQLTVRDVVMLGRTPHRGFLSPLTEQDEAAVDQALAHAGLSLLSGRLWHTLSGGERQRVQIARALAQEPAELLLDEPTNHLDIQHQLDILSLVSRLGITCIVAVHDLNLAAMFCDRLVVLKDGRLAACGDTEEVLTEKMIAAVFGVSVQVTRSSAHGGLNVQYRIR
jgi:iron complex transport system ATP-binding protein